MLSKEKIEKFSTNDLISYLNDNKFISLELENLLKKSLSSGKDFMTRSKNFKENVLDNIKNLHLKFQLELHINLLQNSPIKKKENDSFNNTFDNDFYKDLNKKVIEKIEKNNKNNNFLNESTLSIIQENILICNSCMETTSKGYKLKCKCFYCVGCLKELFLNSIKDFSLMPPRCHQIEIDLSLTENFLTIEEILIINEKLEEFKCKNRFYCQKETCSKFINFEKLNDKIDIIEIDYVYNKNNIAKIFFCFFCSQTHCYECKTKWHEGRSCDNNKINEENKTIEFDKFMQKSGFKYCPHCKCAIELIYGCNHMICRNCSFEFCFICCKEWTKGNGRCKYGCKLFSEKGVDEVIERHQLNNDINNIDLLITNYQNLRRLVEEMNECLHSYCIRVQRKRPAFDRCVNCGFNMNWYFYKCVNQLCHGRVCYICYFHRLR